MSYDLHGVYDLHIHTAPDVTARKLTDLEMAEMAKQAGYRGFMIKSHVSCTAGRAAAVRTVYPELDVVAGIALNRQVGGLNPEAVVAAGKMGAKVVWFPTMDADTYLVARGKGECGITALNENGQVSSEAFAVLEAAKQYDMVVGTGHIGRQEALKLIQAGHVLGLRRMCLTHVTLPVCQMPICELQSCVELGATVEYSYNHVLAEKCSIKYVAEQIKAIGSEHIILSTDLGQSKYTYPTDGLRDFCEKLMEAGVSEQELDVMLKQTPVKLLYQ